MKKSKSSTDTNRLLSNDEFLRLDVQGRRKLFGVKTNYITFCRHFFGEKRFEQIFHTTKSYGLYVEWYKLENSPLGKAMK